ncbi:MAG: hypothetical protein IJ545_04815 [Alphaproteobacteria bacterium]|nr:hypothetical protein [Alphaproteobacteria bacterium]
MTKLQDWLDNNDKTVADMARFCDVKHTVALRWANGARIPSRENMQKIYEYTGGAVDANSFYNINSANRKELNNEENTHGN